MRITLLSSVRRHYAEKACLGKIDIVTNSFGAEIFSQLKILATLNVTEELPVKFFCGESLAAAFLIDALKISLFTLAADFDTCTNGELGTVMLDKEYEVLTDGYEPERLGEYRKMPGNILICLTPRPDGTFGKGGIARIVL